MGITFDERMALQKATGSRVSTYEAIGFENLYNPVHKDLEFVTDLSQGTWTFRARCEGLTARAWIQKAGCPERRYEATVQAKDKQHRGCAVRDAIHQSFGKLISAIYRTDE